MTIINANDLDAQMGRHIDPNSVPKHDGASIGHMQEIIQRGSEQIITEQGGGKRGAAVFGEQEVGGQDFFGSKTIISVNDAPPLMDAHDPVKKVPASVMPPMPAKAPAPTAAPAKRAMTSAELLALMGLKKS